MNWKNGIIQVKQAVNKTLPHLFIRFVIVSKANGTWYWKANQNWSRYESDAQIFQHENEAKDMLASLVAKEKTGTRDCAAHPKNRSCSNERTSI